MIGDKQEHSHNASSAFTLIISRTNAIFRGLGKGHALPLQRRPLRELIAFLKFKFK